MLTFAIVLVSFNLFRFIRNRSCLGYVPKHLIYQLKRKEIIISIFDQLIIETHFRSDGWACCDGYLRDKTTGECKSK